MANSGDQILTWCELEWDTWKADCSGFMKTVRSQAGVSLRGNANQTIDFLSGSSVWKKPGAKPNDDQPELESRRPAEGALFRGHHMSRFNGMRRRAAALALILVASSGANAECRLQHLDVRGSKLRVGATTVNLGTADAGHRARAWQGPLVAGACKLDLGIIEAPLVGATATLLYVPTYSGSVRRLTLVDLRSCSVRWQSAAFSGALRIGPRALDLGGKRIELNASCIPTVRR